MYPANRAPVAGTLADRKIRIGSPDRVDLKNAFTDPDETDVLTYTAASSNEAVATAAVEGIGVLITPRKTGQTRIAVTARDPKGLEGELELPPSPSSPSRPPSRLPRPRPARAAIMVVVVRLPPRPRRLRLHGRLHHLHLRRVPIGLRPSTTDRAPPAAWRRTRQEDKTSSTPSAPPMKTGTD